MISALLLVVLAFCVYFYRRRRVHKLAKKIPSPPDVDNIFGALKYSLRGIEIMQPLIEKYSRFSIKNKGVIKLITEPFLYIVITGRKDAEHILKNCLEKDSITDFFFEITGNAGIYAPETALGINFNAQSESHVPFLKSVSDMLNLVTSRVINIWLWPTWIYKFSRLHSKIQSTKQVLFKLPDKIIQEKFEAIKLKNLTENHFASKKEETLGQKTEVNSFLDHLITLSLEEKGLNKLELREEILLMLLAGTDTTAVTIGYTLLLLAKYPHIQETLYSEIFNVFGDSDRNLNENDLKKLEYLHKVVKESIRLFTPVPIVVRKTGAVEIKLPASGIVLPPGTGCLISLWGLNRDPNYWGPDAENFNPERTWDDSVQNASFGLGPRNCIGYKYALQAVQIAVASVVRRYRVVGRPQTGPPHVPSTYSVMMRSSDDFTVALERR